MNVSTELLLPILESQANLANEENRTWTLSFQPKTVEWTMTDMKDTIKLFQKTGYKENVYDEELIVESEADATSFHVYGIHDISLYCEHENPQTVSGKWYKYAMIQDQNSTQEQIPEIFSLKITSQVKEEHPLEDKQAPPQWSTSLKTYEINKKIVYTDSKTDVRYIISMTKKAVTPTNTMLLSNVSALPPLIKYSIECPADMDVKDIVVSMVRMIQILEQNSRPITLDQQKEVLSNYDSLVDKVRDKQYVKSSYYLAPKPVTLEQIHLSDPGITYGQLSILDGYAVTDKADGERMLLFVDENGDAYMINNAFEVRGTGWRVKRDILYNTLLDGEYLPSSKRLDKSDQDLFAVFDVYFVGGESVMNLPLMKAKHISISEGAEGTEKSKEPKPVKETKPVKEKKTAKEAKVSITGDSRVDIMNAIFQGALWDHEKDTHIELITKVHIAATGNDMFVACRKILEDATKEGSSYDIDGLIFTPVDLPVMGYYPGKPITIKSVSATWDRVLKWKPPQQNSIDFCISIDKNKSTIKDIHHHRTYSKVTLSCGYSALRNEEISVSRGLELLQTPISKRNLKDDYILKAFEPQYYYAEGIQYAYIPLGVDGISRAENGDEITDGAIVEFGYDKTDKRPISYRWRALRVRNDKMRNIITPSSNKTFEQMSEISPSEVKPDETKPSKKQRFQLKTSKANDWKTATGIWRSIHEPVTREMITGVERAPQLVKQAIDLQTRLLGTDAVYYGRNVTREHLLSVEMLNFHNAVIKDNLYKWPQTIAKNNLLELACGMAGDLNRWQDPQNDFAFRNILGVDLVRDNITKAIDGAYARVLKPRYGAPRKHQTYVFVIGDCAKPLHNGVAAKDLDLDSEKVLKELYGKTGRNLLTFYDAFAKNKFDMVSCQFAIHYFFETKQKLEGFMANVRDNLRPNGIFITTFMDGSSVEKLIRDKGKNGLAEGRKLDGKVVVWAIRRIRAVEPESIDEEDIEMDQADMPEYFDEQMETEQEGGAVRKREPIEIIEQDGQKYIYDIMDVPGKGDCMFISLELSAYGEEKSVKKNGLWMRTNIIDTMKEILRKNDENAKKLYEALELDIDNMSPDVKEEATKDISAELLNPSKGTYVEKVAGYLNWMSKKKVWGTSIELLGAVHFLKRPIYVYHTVQNGTKKETKIAFRVGDDLYPTISPVRVWYNSVDHYKALLEHQEPSTELEKITKNMGEMKLPSPSPVPQRSTRSGKVYSINAGANTGANEDESPFGRLIDVYLENTNRLIPEYLVDFSVLCEYARRFGLELVQDAMFSDTYQAHKVKNPNAFPSFDNDPVQKQFSFLNRWAVFRRVSEK